jgi:hypothetical protein
MDNEYEIEQLVTYLCKELNIFTNELGHWNGRTLEIGVRGLTHIANKIKNLDNFNRLLMLEMNGHDLDIDSNYG